MCATLNWAFRKAVVLLPCPFPSASGTPALETQLDHEDNDRDPQPEGKGMGLLIQHDKDPHARAGHPFWAAV